ncbi:hypothetical protein F2P79_002766 [Pimephales promelas]|nr:hypothetical protein F2P79_002766 [Pimephales promelas]
MKALGLTSLKEQTFLQSSFIGSSLPERRLKRNKVHVVSQNKSDPFRWDTSSMFYQWNAGPFLHPLTQMQRRVQG